MPISHVLGDIKPHILRGHDRDLFRSRDHWTRHMCCTDKMPRDKMPHGKKTPGQNATQEINSRTKCHWQGHCTFARLVITTYC